MTEEELQEIERWLGQSQSIYDDNSWVSSDFMDLKPDDIRRLIAEVRRLRKEVNKEYFQGMRDGIDVMWRNP